MAVLSCCVTPNRWEVGILNVNWTPDQLSFIRTVAGSWALGDTQDAIAAEVGLGKGAMFYQLMKLGVKMARGGRLIWTATGEPVDIDCLLESSLI